jgi:hypothetical protein
MSLYDRQEISDTAKYDIFYERVKQDEELCSSVKSRVRSWSESELENLDKPTYDNFIKVYREYRHPDLQETIEQEIERTVKDENERESFGLPFTW